MSRAAIHRRRVVLWGAPLGAMVVALFGVGGLPISEAFAHHSFAMYDQAKVVTLTGTIKEFQWANPHALIYLLRDPQPGESEPAVWTVELPTSPGPLSRLGWTKRSLAAGDRVAIDLNPLRSGAHGGSFKKVTLLKTGQVLVASPSDAGAPPSGAPPAAAGGGAGGK